MGSYDADRERRSRQYEQDEDRWRRAGERWPEYDRGDYGREGGYGGAYGDDRDGPEGYGEPSRDRGYGPPAPTRGYPAAWMIPGPQTGRGPRNYRRSDERIREDVCERLTRHGQLDAADIEVEIRDGEITLRGTVADRRAKRMAEDAAEDVPGVRDIHNRLRLGERRGEAGAGEVGREAVE